MRSKCLFCELLLRAHLETLQESAVGVLCICHSRRDTETKVKLNSRKFRIVFVSALFALLVVVAVEVVAVVAISSSSFSTD